MQEKAILRDVNDQFVSNLRPEEIAHYSALADNGLVARSRKMKKGRMVVVFRMKVIEPPVKPSDSENSDVMLTVDDTEWLAGLNGAPDRAHVERWIGWGLIGSRRPKR